MKQVWQLTDEELDKLVEIMRRHTQLARQATVIPNEKEWIIAEINALERERIELIGR